VVQNGRAEKAKKVLGDTSVSLASALGKAVRPDITGVYALYGEGQQGGTPPAAHMKVSAQQGGQFLVSIAIPTGDAADDWEGRGTVGAKGGSYEWVFVDGKTGQTTFTLQPDGTLKGAVRGSGIDWNYVARRISPPREHLDLVGTYAIYPKGEVTPGPFAMLNISAQRGGQFLVGIALPTGNPSVDWEGHGAIEGEKGYYDWTFPDGKKGRTTITVTADGNLLGEVRGAGIDWDYVGKRLEGPVKAPVQR